MMKRYRLFTHFIPLLLATSFITVHATENTKYSKYKKIEITSKNRFSQSVCDHELLVSANGHCLYTSIILGYLLPVVDSPDRFKKRLGGIVGTKKLPITYKEFANRYHDIHYLHSNKGFQQVIGGLLKQTGIKSGTWGGPKEVKLIAEKLNVNIQECTPNPDNPKRLIKGDLTQPQSWIVPPETTLYIVRDTPLKEELVNDDNDPSLQQGKISSLKSLQHRHHYRLYYKGGLPQSLEKKQKTDNLSLDLNDNNNTKKSGTSSTYTHGDQTGWQEWVKDIKYENLQKPLNRLYKDGIARPAAHITTTLPVYFVIGPKGAGKSTFIFTLQGNQVTKKEPERVHSDDSDSSSDSGEDVQRNKKIKDKNTDDLILKKTVKIATPEVATSTYATTKSVEIYYTGEKKSKKPMAFCDTEGFLGKRKDDDRKAEEIVVDAFAMHFALKANCIGGIVFLVAASDIDSTGGRNFLECMGFLNQYVDLAVTGDRLNTLKKSVMLFINKSSSERTTLKNLAGIVKAVYEDYYKGVSNNNKKDNLDTNPKSNQKELRMGQLKPFFSLFLKKDVDKNKVKETKFHKLLDKKKVRFFHPDDKEDVDKMRTKLLELTPLNPAYLSRQDSPLSQYLIKEITHKSYVINQAICEALKWHNLAQLQSLLLQKDNGKNPETLSAKLKERKKQFAGQNRNILYSKILKCVYDERHIRNIPFEELAEEIRETGLGGLAEATGLVGIGLAVGTAGIGLAVGTLGLGLGVAGVAGLELVVEAVGLAGLGLGVGVAEVGVGLGLVGVGVGGRGLGGGLVGSVVGLGLEVGTAVRNHFFYSGYLRKNFIYTGDAPISRIEIKNEDKGYITWKKPDVNFIAKHFDATVEGTTTTLTPKDKNSVTQNEWHIYHCTLYGKNAHCEVKFFSQRGHLQATKWQSEDYEAKMNRIDNLLKALENSKNTNKDSLEKDYSLNQEKANQHRKPLIEYQKEMKMISCWGNRILKKESVNRDLIDQYRHNYNEAVPSQHQVSIEDDNNHNKMISLPIDKTNSKHSDDQPGLQLKNNDKSIEDEDERKENDDNYSNQHTSSSNLNSPTTPSVTAILAGLLSKKNSNLG